MVKYWSNVPGRAPSSTGQKIQSLPVEAAGKRQPKLQKALTRQLERTLFQRLDVAIRALAVDDMRRCSWLNVDRFSTVWVAAWPDADAFLSNAEFAEVTTFYFGLPSPACRALVGQCLGSSRVVLDAHGNGGSLGATAARRAHLGEPHHRDHNASS